MEVLFLIALSDWSFKLLVNLVQRMCSSLVERRGLWGPLELSFRPSGGVGGLIRVRYSLFWNYRFSGVLFKLPAVFWPVFPKIGKSRHLSRFWHIFWARRCDALIITEILTAGCFVKKTCFRCEMWARRSFFGPKMRARTGSGATRGAIVRAC